MNRIRRAWRLRKLKNASTQQRAQQEIADLKRTPKIPHQPNK
jgi:hypothetical protein